MIIGFIIKDDSDPGHRTAIQLSLSLYSREERLRESVSSYILYRMSLVGKRERYVCLISPD